MMRVAVIERMRLPFSFRNYFENVSRELEKLGVELIRISEKSLIQGDTDLVWYPFSIPPLSLLRSVIRAKKPLVVSLLGDRGLGIPAHVYYGRDPFTSNVLRLVSITILKTKWFILNKYTKAVITVSRYAKKTLVEKLGLKPDKVFVVYHGVDHRVFNPSGPRLELDRPYFLHVSQYNPSIYNKKNLPRILEAYKKLTISPKPYLVLVIPGYPKTIDIDGVIPIRRPLPTVELTKLYRGALAFIFPSLHETFGMPILEAMASGCPVITSNVTACPEVVGDAALLVNPYSTKSIAEAMELIATDDNLRRKLIAKGLERAKEFTWRRSALKHKAIFEWVLKQCITELNHRNAEVGV